MANDTIAKMEKYRISLPAREYEFYLRVFKLISHNNFFSYTKEVMTTKMVFLLDTNFSSLEKSWYFIGISI